MKCKILCRTENKKGYAGVGGYLLTATVVQCEDDGQLYEIYECTTYNPYRGTEYAGDVKTTARSIAPISKMSETENDVMKHQPQQIEPDEVVDVKLEDYELYRAPLNVEEFDLFKESSTNDWDTERSVTEDVYKAIQERWSEAREKHGNRSSEGEITRD